MVNPGDEVDQRRARDELRERGMDAGPQTIIQQAEALKEALVPRIVETRKDLLAGRISLTKEEASLALGISLGRLEGALKRGEIPSVSIAGRRLVPVKALEDHLTALAYADSGALDAWERALIKGMTMKMRRARRLAVQRRKAATARLKAARRRGLDPEQVSREYLAQLKRDAEELQVESLGTSQIAESVLHEVEVAERALERS